MISASNVALGLECGWSFRNDIAVPKREQTHDAQVGTEFASLVDLSIQHGANDLAIESVEPKPSKEAQALWYVWESEWWYPRRADEWASEMAIAIDPQEKTARRLTQRWHRDYSQATEREIPGTLDAYVITADALGSYIDLVDFKTGFDPPKARDNKQLLTLGLGLAIYYDVWRVRGTIAHVTLSGVREDTVEFHERDLEKHRWRLVQLLESIDDSSARKGQHCKDMHCKVYGACPETNVAISQVAPKKTRLPIVMDAAQIQGPEHAKELYEYWRFAIAKLGFLGQALRTYARERGRIALGDGRYWGLGVSSREKIEIRSIEAIEKLREVLGAKHANDAIEYSVTKKSIELAARKRASETGQSIASVKRLALDALAKAGAISSKEKESFGESEGRGEK